MADEGVLEAEATIDSRLNYQQPRRAHHAQDAFNPQINETSALLGHDRDSKRRVPEDDDQASSGGADEDGSTEDAWHGDRDFQHLPYWRRPSVRLIAQE